MNLDAEVEYITDMEKVMSKESKAEGINSFQKYLSVWVLLCMAVGILIGKFLPEIPAFLDKLSIAGISIHNTDCFYFCHCVCCRQVVKIES